ncbi:MAG: hypothetical protein EHM89_03805 [Acidobacteria bacterium]|nr:MAG: hypothetical protein EHM89_03805 [Acidobacteriota bacterium]
MNAQTVLAVGTLTIVTATVGLAPLQGSAQQNSTAYTAPRTPWGDPDLQGVFTTDDELGVPFERPEQFGARALVTDAEFAEREAQARRQSATDAEEFVAPRVAGRGGDGTGPPAHWLERGKPSRRTSLVIDPPDGRIPYVNEQARQRNAAAVNARTSGNRPFDGPEALDLYDRCITRGLPHVIFPTIYNNTSQIVQGPGYVAIFYEMIHDARVIPLDGRPHLSSTIRPYFGDSRGRWEGDTLVVDVTNFPNHLINYRGAGASLDIIERFRRVDDHTIRYEVTVEDSTTFTRPWTAALSLKQDARQAQVLEYACHEGNYAMTNILSGARAAEKSDR